jgi:hypothetical protein
MALLYGRAGRLTAENGGLRPGQCHATYLAAEAGVDPAGLDEGLLSLPLSNLLYMENPYSFKKYQWRITARPRISTQAAATIADEASADWMPAHAADGGGGEHWSVDNI